MFIDDEDLYGKQKPWEHIRDLRNERKGWSDEAILAELKALSVLPNEDDKAWDNIRTWRELADLYVALGDLAADRKLLEAIPLLLERAAYGDPGEMMRGLRHSLERIVDPNWSVLTQICMQAAHYLQPGARLWAISELGVLRESQSLQTLIDALDDEMEQVRFAAISSIAMVCQTNHQCRNPSRKVLQTHLARQLWGQEYYHTRDTLDEIVSMDKPK